jgi:hypothetical protein
MNTYTKPRRPRRADVQLAKLRWLWFRMSKPERDAWREIFSLDVPTLIIAWLIRHELNVKLRSEAQLLRFMRWVLEFEEAMQLRNN